MNKERTSGILMPIFSLPSPYGIGTLGKEAFAFVDFLSECHVTLWQMLPLNVTSYGDSPYQSPSSNGLNYYFIDLETLREEGLLTNEEIDTANFGSDPRHVPYAKLFDNRIPLLKKAFARFDHEDPEFLRFERSGKYRDLAFYMTLKSEFSFRPWYEWDDSYRLYSEAIENWALSERKETYLFFLWTQYEFLREYQALKKYANSVGVSLIGDMPLYLSRDSVEAYKYPKLFLFDQNQNPTIVAGCPPDEFSENGQLWGNPIYDWEYQKSTGYAWFNERIRQNLEIFDILRIDHFRGFAGYYAIPFGRKDARIGKWLTGPGFDFFKDKTDLPIIAEDLGFLDQPVIDLLRETTYPGMKILEFAFDGDPKNIFKPTNCTANYICYTGTHDNMPIRGYLDSLYKDDLALVEKDVKKQALAFAVPYQDSDSVALTDTIVSLCYAAPTFAAVLPIQDLLDEGNDTRLNVPSVLSDKNWTYRTIAEDFTDDLKAKIQKNVSRYHR